MHYYPEAIMIPVILAHQIQISEILARNGNQYLAHQISILRGKV